MFSLHTFSRNGKEAEEKNATGSIDPVGTEGTQKGAERPGNQKEKTMADTNEREKITFRALPELVEAKPLDMASDVEALLSLLMEMTGVTAEDFRLAMEQHGHGLPDNPVILLFHKIYFLIILIWRLLTFRQQPLPEAIFAPLLRLAVYEPNPSFNRWFIEPCQQAFGYRRVLEALLDYLEHGTNREKAGATRACYWAWRPTSLDRKDWKKAEQKIWNELGDLRMKMDMLLLKTFIENENLDVRRSIIPQLSLQPSRYPQEWKRLILPAIHLARTHPDDYIRHRVEIQLREGGRPERVNIPLTKEREMGREDETKEG